MYIYIERERDVFLSLSLSLSLYICIYVYKHVYTLNIIYTHLIRFCYYVNCVAGILPSGADAVAARSYIYIYI